MTKINHSPGASSNGSTASTDPSITSQSASDGERSPSKYGSRRIWAALLLLLAMAVASGCYWFFFLRGIVYSDDARVDGDLVDVAPQIGGNIKKLLVREGDTVVDGQLLFTLDSTALEAAVARAAADEEAARARLAIANAEAEKALHGPRAAEVRIALAAKQSADAQTRFAADVWERTRILFERGSISDAARIKAQTDLETAQRAQAEADNRLNLLNEGTRREDIAASQANVEKAQADLAAATANSSQMKVNLDYAEVRAPFAGVVVRKWRAPGATINAGTPVLTLLNPNSLHVSANIDEKDLAGVAVGDRVDISVDAFPDAPLMGRVQNVLRATNSKFGLIPSEGVSGTFIKVVQRVPLRIAIESRVDGLRLSPGLSVEIRVHIGSQVHAGPRPVSRETASSRN